MIAAHRKLMAVTATIALVSVCLLADMAFAQPSEPPASPVLSGTAACDASGELATWHIIWQAQNTSDASLDVTSAGQSGAVEGEVTFVPNPVPGNSSSFADVPPVPGSTTGTVTVHGTWTLADPESPAQGEFNAEVELDTSCVAAVTTATTSEPFAARVAPRLTG